MQDDSQPFSDDEDYFFVKPPTSDASGGPIRQDCRHNPSSQIGDGSAATFNIEIETKKKKCLVLFVGAALCALVIISAGAYLLWPATKTILSEKKLQVTGIFYSDTPSAIVDGQIVKEGSTIKGAKVIKINKNCVEFEKSGGRWSQSMPPAEQDGCRGLPVLLELTSPKCPACRKMTPILNELEDEYRGKFRIMYIDVWEDRAAGEKYRVKAIPTQIFYNSEGEELCRHVGHLSKKDILAMWKKLGVKL